MATADKLTAREITWQDGRRFRTELRGFAPRDLFRGRSAAVQRVLDADDQFEADMERAYGC